ncbi:hypothetical protein XfCFBP8082_03195 [Xylella fastidiosa subsp. fastidiosa]|uniref:Uncharacterized protein n=2 Tax=Xylella fastidiosa TaxID=2371 RepID=Q87FC3_XYLFT|nr:conserved hypothetical protein [Xylella fastidiosa Temecula1]ADN62999.1 hypothetical protein XFLM_05235 [Xylella fastidiosa subsp. fastidiosa GB514]KGM21298.1 hypothetical protein JT24_00020 [Xylella fastidiosa]NBI37736.1 hypothetical protein [Xylella fastidiosa subsp. fastidiosa]QIS24798.1 hypothetical protein F7G16_00020 [Xylella fastidiosa]
MLCNEKKELKLIFLYNYRKCGGVLDMVAPKVPNFDVSLVRKPAFLGFEKYMDRYIFNFRMEISALMRLNFEVIDMEPMKNA